MVSESFVTQIVFGLNKFSEFCKSLSPESLRNMHHFGDLNNDIKIAEAYVKIYTDTTYKPFVLIRDKDIKIMALAFLKGTGKVRSLGIIVRDDMQGQRVGSELMKMVIEGAKEAGVKKIWLQVYEHNETAISLYEKFGFYEEGVFKDQEYDENDNPLTVVSMGLRL